jgi:2-oxoglutarate ferredoxin oxidoreductase subunit delta
VPKITIDPMRCKGCGLCTIACPRNLIVLSERINSQGYLPADISREDLKNCTSCAMCARMCPDVAIAVFRETEDGDDGAE